MGLEHLITMIATHAQVAVTAEIQSAGGYRTAYKNWKSREREEMTGRNLTRASARCGGRTSRSTRRRSRAAAAGS
jgi:hypothetical protein